MTALEHCARSYAKRITQDGVVKLVTDGHPALVAAFRELGWPDPYPDPLLLPKPDPRPVTASVRAAERAVLPSPKGRLDGGV